MATYSSVLAWRIPGTGEPSGPPSMGSHRVGFFPDSKTIPKGRGVVIVVLLSVLLGVLFVFS